MAASVAEALTELRPDFRSVTVDLFRECLPLPLRKAARLYGPLVRRAPGVWHLAWRLSRGRRRTDLLRRAIRPLFVGGLARVLTQQRPAAVVAVQALGHDPAIRVAERLDSPPRVVTLVTDPIEVHPLWIRPGADLYLVGSERARRQAVSYGAPEDHVRDVGLPVGRAFLQLRQEREQVQEGLGLDPARFTVLVVGGGEGVGDLAGLVGVLAGSGLPLQILAVAGRNEKMRRQLERDAWSVPVRVFGFTDQMAPLMHAADCVLTKAGPSTVAEALVTGTPMVLMGFIPGQETENVGWVCEAGAAIYAPNPVSAQEGVARLMRERPVRRAMVRAAQSLARPDAAQDAAEAILDLID